MNVYDGVWTPTYLFIYALMKDWLTQMIVILWLYSFTNGTATRGRCRSDWNNRQVFPRIAEVQQTSDFKLKHLINVQSQEWCDDDVEDCSCPDWRCVQVLQDLSVSHLSLPHNSTVRYRINSGQRFLLFYLYLFSLYLKILYPCHKYRFTDYRKHFLWVISLISHIYWEFIHNRLTTQH